jgi:hypothetical protein
VVVLVAVGMGTVDPGKILVNAGSEQSCGVTCFFGPVGRDGAPKLGQLDPAALRFTLLQQIKPTTPSVSLAALLVFNAGQQLPNDAE